MIDKVRYDKDKSYNTKFGKPNYPYIVYGTVEEEYIVYKVEVAQRAEIEVGGHILYVAVEPHTQYGVLWEYKQAKVVMKQTSYHHLVHVAANEAVA